ncbi:hypothetical protein GGX14DRAFT_399134 [Mycena pura]|uniref:Ribonuclease H1 N-terminal domain-containing protein n=1 Tax=Mycena pura TaxID=153505 RepID=A0AAD6V4F2_9AGAR|nr:hypothetical protein GGX14DRAFT_399134 [Mycena pura]
MWQEVRRDSHSTHRLYSHPNMRRCPSPDLSDLLASVSLQERTEAGSRPAPLPVNDLETAEEILPVFDIDEIWESLTPEERGEGTTRRLEVKKKGKQKAVPPPGPAPPPGPPLLSRPASQSLPPAPAHAALPKSAPLYVYSSPATPETETTHWYRAAHATQGVAGSGVRAVVKSPRNKRQKHAAFVVFWGHSPGVKETWAETQAATSKFSCAIYQVPLDIARIPTPVPDDRASIARLCSSRHSTDYWYVCFKGVNPGVFSTWIECALNIHGVKNATHQSFERYDIARREYETALSGGHVAVLRTRR